MFMFGRSRFFNFLLCLRMNVRMKMPRKRRREKSSPFEFPWYLFSIGIYFRAAHLICKEPTATKRCVRMHEQLPWHHLSTNNWRQRGWLRVSEESWVPGRHIKNRLWPCNLSKPIKWTRWTPFDRYVYTLEFPALVLHIKMNNKWAPKSFSPNLSKPHFLAFTSSSQIHTSVVFFRGRTFSNLMKSRFVSLTSRENVIQLNCIQTSA